MGKLRSIIQKSRSILLLLTILLWQIIIPLAASERAFAANPSADLDQCRNGTLASPSQCLDLGGNTGWVNGNAGSSDSHWREGDSIAYRMRFSNLTVGTHSVTIQWDTTKSGKHAIDYLTTFNRTETTANPCSGVSGCGSPTTFAIPDDPNSTVTQVPGNFTLYNGTVTSLSSYTLSGTYAGDSSTSLTINFTAASATPVLAWGGHIASQLDWGFGNSASAVSGSPYHTRLLDLDGSGGNQDRSLAAAAVFPTPTITTQVSASSINLSQTVTDTATLVGPGNNPSPVTGTVNFFVCGPSNTNPDCTTGGSQVGSAVTIVSGQATSSAFSPQATGSYCFRAEYTPAASAPYSPQNHTNLTTECFSVSAAPSSITIVKDAIPNSSQDFAFTTTGTGLSDFSLDDDSDSTLSNTKAFNNLLPGTYTVTEQSVAGWDFDNISCTNNGATVQKNGTTVTITITGGQNVSCTYTNRQRGHIVVHKVTNPANDPTGFSITASGTPTISGATAINGNATQTLTTSQDVTYDVAAGTYAVDESAAAGWSEDDSACASLTINGNTPLVNGVPTVSCTITNTKLAKLKIIKSTSPSSSSQTFSFGSTGPSITNQNNAFILDTNGADNTYPNNYQYVDLTPGSYGVTETEPSGWQLTNLVCTGATYTWPGDTQTLSLNLVAGADVTCTFTNTQYGSISGFKFESNANSSTVGPLGDWTINLLLDGQQYGSTSTDNSGAFSFSNLLPGSYTLAEVLQNGWTQIYSPSGVSLTAGQTSTDNDFGNFENATISGSKFNDLNGNHEWDSGEPGLQGWTITLYDNGGSGALLDHQVSQTTTAADGTYSFTNLPPTNYKVCEIGQTNWNQTYPTSNGGCNLVTVALSGHNYSGNDFGNQGQGTITVIKNVDTNGDGTVDQQDVTDWTWNYDGSYGNDSYVSTGSGNSINVAAGAYTVSENQIDGYHVTSSVCSSEEDRTLSTSKDVTVDAGENVTCTFTNTRDTGGINGSKFNDLNGNGTWDEGEPTLSDWTINLYECEDLETFAQLNLIQTNENCGSAIQTTQTDENGNYSFSNLPTNLYSTYLVCEVQQDGWVQTFPSSNNGCHDVSLDENGQISDANDFGNFQNGTISGFKFDDLNGNATFDNGDIKLKNWTINLMQDGQVVDTTTTDTDGNYSFTNVAAGEYQVCEVQQTGFVRTFPVNSDCQDVTIDTSGQTVTALFGNKEKGEVLGATTLVNTGQPISYSIIAGLGILTAISAVSFFARRQNR